MLTLTYGVAQIRAALEWSETALATLTIAERDAAPNPQSNDTNAVANDA
jgi:hypothetical protein